MSVCIRVRCPKAVHAVACRAGRIGFTCQPRSAFLPLSPSYQPTARPSCISLSAGFRARACPRSCISDHCSFAPPAAPFLSFPFLSFPFLSFPFRSIPPLLLSPPPDMGCGSSSTGAVVQPPVDATTAAFDRLLEEEKAEAALHFKLLCLGAGESGKSTVRRKEGAAASSAHVCDRPHSSLSPCLSLPLRRLSSSWCFYTSSNSCRLRSR